MRTWRPGADPWHVHDHHRERPMPRSNTYLRTRTALARSVAVGATLVLAAAAAAACSGSVAGTTVKRSSLPLEFTFGSECAGFRATEGGATSSCRRGEFT